jgi:hypothetical protein
LEHSAGERPEGQLPLTWLPLQVHRASRGYVDDQPRFDRPPRIRLAPGTLAYSSSRHRTSTFYHIASRVTESTLQNFWVKDHRQIYLIGNPVVWYLSTWSILVYVAVRGLLLLRQQRGFRDFENSQ